MHVFLSHLFASVEFGRYYWFLLKRYQYRSFVRSARASYCLGVFVFVRFLGELVYGTCVLTPQFCPVMLASDMAEELDRVERGAKRFIRDR